MARSLRFGSTARDSFALFRLAFATASPLGLTSPRTITRRLILQKARRHPTLPRTGGRLRRIVSARFQVLFHSPPGVLFTIPSRYYSLSVIEEYLGLPRGRGRFTRDFTGPVLLGCTFNGGHRVSSTGLSPAMAGLPRPFDYTMTFLLRTPLTEGVEHVPLPRMCNACQLSHTSGLA